MSVRKVRLLNVVDFAVVDYEQASDVIIDKAVRRESFSVFAMPVHGLVLAATDKKMTLAARKAHLVVPDGQPIRWAMNFFYKTDLKDRVYGPTLTLHVLRKSQQKKLKIFLYGGSSTDTLDKFEAFINKNYPDVTVCGKYRESSPDGNTLSIETINASGANIILIGRGCPTQELWISKNQSKVQGAMLAVGAAFSFHAGTVAQAPRWMQDRGLEWLFRLTKEPQRLFKRYFITNSLFILLIVDQFFKMRLSKKYRYSSSSNL